MNKNKALVSLLVLVAAQLSLLEAARATIIQHADFSSTAGLTLNGDAAVVGDVLRLTQATDSQAGSAFSTSPISLAADVSFSTAFTFRFTAAGGLCDAFPQCGADGLVFVVQTVANNVGGSGGGIGYAGIPNSVGIEFDTWRNGEFGDFSSNHVGANVGGSVASLVQIPVSAGDMNNGATWSAWIDYNGSTNLLEVFLSTSSARPDSPILSTTRNLALDLGSTDAFVGFTSGTGAAWANHDVLSWTFIDTFAPIDEPAPVPAPPSLTLFVLGLAMLGLARRNRQQA